MKDKVRRMAENAEPKCKNCRHWFETMPYVTTMRPCRLNSHVVSDASSTQGKFIGLHTTDLSLCSAWEPKE